NFAPYIQNIEGFELELTASGNDNVMVDISGYQVSFIPESNWNGNEIVWFHLINQENNINVTDSLNIIVNPVNDAPQLELPELVSGLEDAVIEIDQSLYGTDIDSEILTYSIGESDFQYTLNGSELTIWLGADENGSGTISITVSDGYLTASGILNAMIEPVNDAPWLALPELMSFAEDSSLNIDLSQYSGDVDGDFLTYTVASSDLNIDQTGSIIELSAPFNWFGAAEVEINVNDGVERITITDTLDVNVTSVNDPPELVLPDSISFNEDESYMLDLSDYAYDIDGDELVLNLYRIELIVESDSLILIISAPANWNGEELLEICIDDGEIEVCDQMQVAVLPVNDLPELYLPSELNFQEDSELIIDIGEYCTDIDNDPLSLTASSDILILNWEELELQITAPPDWNGEAELTITISDGNGGEVADNIVVTVENMNDYPVINLPVSFTFAEDENLIIDLSQYCSDVDGDELEYSVNCEVIIASITDSVLSLSAPEDWNGSEVIAISIDDGQVRVESSDLTTIIVEPVNDAPILNLPAEVSFAEDTTYYINLSPYLSDIDDSMLQLEVAEETDNIIIQLEGYVALLSAMPNFFGTEEVLFSLNDGEFTVYDSLLVIVTEVNDVPEINLPNRFYFNEDESLQVDFEQYIDDIDGDELSLIATGGDQITYYIDAYTVFFSAAENWNGSEVITFIIDDGQGRAMASDQVEVVVNAINDPPVVNFPLELSFNEDEEYLLQIADFIWDVDSPELSYQFSSEILLCAYESENLLVWAPDNYFGNCNLIVEVSDEEFTISSNISIEIIAVNDSPVINLPASITFNEDTEYSFDLSDYSQDIDSDSLEYTAFSEQLILELTGSELIISAAANWNGDAELEISVSDGELFDTAIIAVDINAV
ncbi:MAG: tandem-95 repeat protein, partial [Candidatus Stygibacter australis]|nr:tandem-95 repeat protein [Candidatus Stygibacter australis]